MDKGIETEKGIYITPKEAELSFKELLLYRIFRFWRTNYPDKGDRFFFKPVTKTVAAGATEYVIINVPKDEIWYLKKVWYTVQTSSNYSVSKDDGAQIVDSLSFGGNLPINVTPPEPIYNKLKIKIVNSHTASQDYNIAFEGYKVKK